MTHDSLDMSKRRLARRSVPASRHKIRPTDAAFECDCQGRSDFQTLQTRTTHTLVGIARVCRDGISWGCDVVKTPSSAVLAIARDIIHLPEDIRAGLGFQALRHPGFDYRYENSLLTATVFMGAGAAYRAMIWLASSSFRMALARFRSL